MPDTKCYDRAYFDQWYRSPAASKRSPALLARQVGYAVAAAEWFLGRPLRSVLDVGCGEGHWRAPLRKLRPQVHYLGLDASEYAVRRFGARRHLHHARFGDLAQLRPCPPADLVVCADVLHYLSDRELRAGLPGLAALCGGVAYLETYTAEDTAGAAIEGDFVGFRARPARAYRQALRRVGFRALGGHLWLGPALADEACALELGDGR
jgi:SAM-dependent methyltransferase